MTTVTFDTHQVILALKKRGFSEDQAKGITEALQEINLDGVASKSDIVTLKAEFKAEIFELKAEIFKWLIPLFIGQYALIIGVLLKMH